MSKQCVIIGCGSHAAAVISIVESSVESYEIIGLVDTADSFDKSEKKSGYNVILNVTELLSSSKEYAHLYCILAIGDNVKRKEIFDELVSKNLKLPNIISSRAFVDRTVVMDHGNVVGHGSIINAQAKLGNNNLLNTCSLIEHGCCIGNHVHVGPRAVLCGDVRILDSVFIGVGAVVIPHLLVEQSSIVGAGAVVINSITEKNSTYIGIPAKEKIK